MTRPRIGLGWKVGALMSALAAGLVTAGVGAVWLRTQGLAGPELESAVLRAGDRVGDAVTARLDRLDLITRLLVNDPPFRAYVAEGHIPSILDNLQDRLALYSLDAFVITDARGAPLADTRQGAGAAAPRRTEEPLPALLSDALAGDSSRGLWVDPSGTIYLAAAAPLPAGDAAAIMALEEIGGSLASDWRQATGAELVFFSGEPGSMVPGASTLPLSRSQLARILSRGAPAAGAPPLRLEADSEEFVARTTLLTDDRARPAGFVALRSVDRELASFRKIQATLLAVGIGAVPLALVLGILFARRITRPIAALVRATDRVRAGDYTAPLPPETHDEVGALAGAFRMMVAQLREKEEMDAWIGALAARVAGEPGARAGRAPGPHSGAPTRDLPDRREGETIAPGALLQNRFRILAHLGSGGMGTVWKVRDERLGEMVALKILPAEVMAADPDRMERFRQEITLARRVTHRNVLRTHELLELGDAWAILMEHVDGVPLGRLLSSGRLPRAAGIRIATQICDGLEAAHEQGVIHRDLKPSNVLVDTAGGVKIADFGLARAADGSGPTRSGAAMGTPHYMSPEQAQGLPADHRADIYSAGVMFYEIFCGRRPFEADSALPLLRAHVDAPPPPPRSVNASLGVDLEEVLLRALAKSPGDRYASARDLREAISGTSAAGSDDPAGRAAAPSIGAKLLIGLALAAACVTGFVRAEEAEPAGRRPFLIWTGDAFFRYETVRDAPNPETSDFVRERLRLRPGVEAGSDHVTFGAGLRASLGSDREAENVIRLDNFVSDEVALDRAYVRFAAPLSAFTATVGLAPSPFGGTEVLWDHDIRFAGAIAGWEMPPAGPLVAQRIVAGVSVGSQDREDESLAASARWEAETGAGLSFGAAFWYFDRTEALIRAGYARTNRLAEGGEEFLSDFQVVNVTVGWEHLGDRRPLRLRLDLLYNAGADNRRSGGDLRVDWGELQDRWTWRARLILQRVEQDATLAAFGGDEWWFRTDQRGARLAFALALHRRAFIEATYLRQRRDSLDEWLDRTMLDLVMRF